MSSRMWRIMYVPKTGGAGNRFVKAEMESDQNGRK